MIAPENDRQDGWWEAIVVDKRGNTLTLRWRDYPKLALITRKRDAFAPSAYVTSQRRRDRHGRMDMLNG